MIPGAWNMASVKMERAYVPKVGMANTVHLVCFITFCCSLFDQCGLIGLFAEGCVNGCSRHGECVHHPLDTFDDEQWSCECENGFSGLDCSVALESQCGDNIDNDNGKLLDNKRKRERERERDKADKPQLINCSIFFSRWLG